MRCTWLPTDPATVDPQQHRLASSHICKCLSSSADYEACVSSIRGCQEIQDRTGSCVAQKAGASRSKRAAGGPGKREEAFDNFCPAAWGGIFGLVFGTSRRFREYPVEACRRF